MPVNMIPFQPQTIDEQRQRYEAMLVEKVDLESLGLGLIANPNDTRRYLFDFAIGIRLTICRYYDEKGTGLYLSAKMMPGTCAFSKTEQLRQDNKWIDILEYINTITFNLYKELVGELPEVKLFFLRQATMTLHILLADDRAMDECIQTAYRLSGEN